MAFASRARFPVAWAGAQERGDDQAFARLMDCTLRRILRRNTGRLQVDDVRSAAIHLE